MENRKKRDVENVQQNIINILKSASGDKEDIAYRIYTEITCLEEEGSEALEFFLENSEQIESTEEKRVEKIFSEEEKYQYAKTYGKIIDGTLEILLKKGLNKKQFYVELWKFIYENPILEGDKLKAFALFYIWIDVRVPYYEMESGMKMGNDEYAEICKELFEKIRKARFILNIPTEQKTERASRLINLLNEVKSQREQVVLMTQILNLSDKSEMIISQLIKDKVLEEGKIQ